jgi:AraC-like DNA-binding protein
MPSADTSAADTSAADTSAADTSATPDEPTIQHACLVPFAEALTELDADAQALFSACGLPLDPWADPAAEIPERRLWRLVERAAAEVRPDFGLFAAQRADLEDIVGPLAKPLRAALNLGQALDTFCGQVNRVSSHANFWVDDEREEAWLCRQPLGRLGRLRTGRVPAEQYTVVMMVRLVQLGNPTWTPSRLRTRWESCPPAAFGGADVVPQEPLTALAFPRALLHRPVTPSAREPDLLRTLRAELGRGLPRDLEAAAEVLESTPRTLQRHLHGEGLTFTRLVDQVLFAQAHAAMVDPDRPRPTLTELALDLGYSDPAHFTRAFRRWSGLSPSRYRALL